MTNKTNDQNHHTQPPARTSAAALAARHPNLTEHDLLAIIEGSIPEPRLLQIRDTIAADPALRAELARMKRDREQLQSIDASTQAPPHLIASAIARASREPTSLDRIADLADTPAWNPEASTTTTTTTHEPGRATPAHTPPHTHPRARSRKAIASLIAISGFVVIGAIALSASLGLFDTERTFIARKRPMMAPAPTEFDALPPEEQQRIAAEATREQQELLLKRDQLAEHLIELIPWEQSDEPLAESLAALDDPPAGRSIDEMLAELTADLVLESELTDLEIAEANAMHADPVGATIRSAGLDAQALGRLAREGRLQVSIESADPIRLARQLITPSIPGATPTPAPGAPTNPPNTTITLLDINTQQNLGWTAASPLILTPAATASSSITPPSTDTPPTTVPNALTPETREALERIRSLRESLRRAEQANREARDRSDPVYRIAMPDLAALAPEPAGERIVAALRELVAPGDRIAFFELPPTPDAAPPATSTPRAAPDPNHPAGIIIQLHTRPRD
ncbi:MAG: hypothetical protein ACTS3F_07585 [Phycisphaerales bacterium]